MFFYEDDSYDECNCQGPGVGCFICNPSPTSEDMKEQVDTFIRDVHQPYFNRIMEDELQTIKVKWIQLTTEKSTLVRTKNEWLWIPLYLISSIKRTKKGWKIKVKSCFKKNPTTIDTHHYFERKEYEL